MTTLNKLLERYRKLVKTMQAQRERLQAEFDQLITKSDELIEAWKNVSDEDYARAEAKRA
jgi:hypothetical protein